MNLDHGKVRKAQSLIEFAIILPVLFLMLMLIFDVGRSVYTYSVIHNAAREGARYGIIHPTEACTEYTGAEARARHLTSGLNTDPAVFQVTCTLTPTTSTTPGTFKVRISYTFSAATPLLGRLLGNSSNKIDLVSQSMMYLEN